MTKERRPAAFVVNVLRWLLGFALRLVGAIVAVAFMVMVAIELSFRGGFRATLLPSGPRPGSERDRRLIEDFRLDDNVFERLYHWVVDGARGDFGISTRQGADVAELIVPRIPISLELMLVGVGGAVLLGIPLGLLAAAWSGRKRAMPINGFLGLSQSVPIYVTPFVLIWLLAVRLQWLPAAGWTRISESLTGNLETLLLPAAALVFAEVGPVARIVRADSRIVLEQPYIHAAMAKGLSTATIMRRHVLRPASLGLLNIVGINIGSLLSGTILIELIFGIGAMGQLVLQAITNRDLYLILGLTTYMVVVYVSLNAVVDLTLRWLDPRISSSSRSRRAR